jgi:hypothetical protein
MKQKVMMIALLALGSVVRLHAQEVQPPIVGGACTYQTIKGTAKIISISPAPENENNCPDAQKVKIKFVETVSKKVTESFITIYDGKNPSKAWIKRNKLTVGKSLQGVKSIIKTGTCTPVVYSFPSLKTLADKYCQ